MKVICKYHITITMLKEYYDNNKICVNNSKLLEYLIIIHFCVGHFSHLQYIQIYTYVTL